eukprot:TRINITY_DN77068_c0_g1_i1.p1 TRINITY_DN77068_c0_g1~~TRINITY_DN77068_c0_g1_i1.p1  ORF type:complete len:154 (-),score=17.36 TRINITY_DN77068_c0_g1_i1:492-953(-)
MLVRFGSRSPECSTQQTLTALSTRLFSRCKHGQGFVEKEYTASRLQTCFAFGRSPIASSITHFCDYRLMTLNETDIGFSRTSNHNMMSLILDFLLSIFTHRFGLQTTAKMLPSHFDDCALQAQVLEYTQGGGPLRIGGHDARAYEKKKVTRFI